MRIAICLIVAVTVCSSLPTAVDVRSRSNCENVRGSVRAQVTGNSAACPVATIAGQVFDETDTLIGETTACITNFEQSGDGSIHADLTHSYTLGNLSFSTIDQGVLTLVAPDLYRFENRLTIVDGAAGFLRARGSLIGSSGEIELTYNGRICGED